MQASSCETKVARCWRRGTSGKGVGPCAAGIARMRGVVRQSAAVVLVCRINAVRMRGCVPACRRLGDCTKVQIIGPIKPVMRPREALQCRLVPGVLLMRRRMMCFALKRILSGCMQVFGPWDHSAAQHVGGEIDPGLLRMLLACMLFMFSFPMLFPCDLGPWSPDERWL